MKHIARIDEKVLLIILELTVTVHTVGSDPSRMMGFVLPRTNFCGTYYFTLLRERWHMTHTHVCVCVCGERERDGQT